MELNPALNPGQGLSEEFITEYSNDPSKIIELFQLACNQENHWHLDKPEKFNSLLFKMHVFGKRNEIKNKQMDQIIGIITHIFPSVTSLTRPLIQIFLKIHITDENVYSILAAGKEANDRTTINDALDYLSAKTRTKITLNDDFSLTIEINGGVTKYFLEKFPPLSKVYGEKISIVLKPTLFQLQDLKDFTTNYGIYISKIESFRHLNVNDSDLQYIIQNCPNIKELAIISTQITKTSLETLNHLKGLTSLYINNENIETLPDLSKLIHLTSLKLFCKNLKELPDLSNFPNLNEIALLDCENLTDEQRLIAFSHLVKHNVMQAMKLLNGFEIKNLDEVRKILIPKLEEKINDQRMDPESSLALARKIIDSEVILQLHDEHPLLQMALFVQSANSIKDEKNPGFVYKKAVELSKQPCDFKPPTMMVEGINVAFDSQQLKKLAQNSNVPREDLPKEATLKAFDQLTEALLIKFEKHPTETADLLKALGFSQEHVTISIPYLQTLLNINSGIVSEAESKWKAVVNALLNENTELAKKSIFTNQEVALITVLCGIGNCGPKKNEGIATAYELIDSKYKYTTSVPEWISAEERKKLNEQEDSIHFIKTFIEKHPNNTLETIMKSVNTGEALAMHAMQLLAETEESGFWEWEWDDEKNGLGVKMDESGLLPVLSPKGALALLNLPKASELRNKLLAYLMLEFKSFMKKQFQNNEILKDLVTSDSGMKESVHQWLYIENLIGPFVGTNDKILYDRHSRALDTDLLKKSREEILEVFFKHVTPQAIVDELTHNLNQSPADIKEALKMILPEDQFWANKETATLNKAGTLKLLLAFNFLT